MLTTSLIGGRSVVVSRALNYTNNTRTPVQYTTCKQHHHNDDEQSTTQHQNGEFQLFSCLQEHYCTMYT